MARQRQNNKKELPWLIVRAQSLFLSFLMSCFGKNLTTLAIALAIALIAAIAVSMKNGITYENIVAIPDILESLFDTTVETILDTQSKAILHFFNFLFADVAFFGWLHQYTLAHAPNTNGNGNSSAASSSFRPSSIGNGLRLVNCRFNVDKDNLGRINDITAYFAVSNKTAVEQSVIIEPCLFMNGMNAVYRFIVRTYTVPPNASILTTYPYPLHLERDQIEKILQIQRDNNYNSVCSFHFIINSQTKYTEDVDIR